MPEYTVPEIQRTSLTSVVLTLKCLGVHDVIRYTDTYCVSTGFLLVFFMFFSNEFISFKVSLSGFPGGKIYSRSAKAALSV